MNYKRKKSRYQFRCTRCNQSRFATMQGDLNHKDIRNQDKIKEAKREIQERKER